MGLRQISRVAALMILGDRGGGADFSAQDLDMLKCVGDHATASLVNGELWISSGASDKSFTCKTGVGCSRVGADATYVPPSGHWTRH